MYSISFAIRKSLIINLGWFNAWLAFLGGFCYLSVTSRVFPWFVGLCLILFSLIANFINPSIATTVNYLGLSVLVLCVVRKTPHSLAFARLYIYTGLFIGAYLISTEPQRLGNYGMEPNFSGLYIWIFITILIFNRHYREALLVFSIGVFLTMSKALMISSALAFLLYVLRGSRFLTSITAVFVLIIVLSTQFLDINSFAFVDFFRMGYSENIDRLVFLIDSSFLERRDTVSFWLKVLRESTVPELLFGQSPVYDRIPHNSFVQKALDHGVVFVLFLSAIILWKLGFWISFPYLFYSVYLHNTLSVGVFLLLLLFTGGARLKREA